MTPNPALEKAILANPFSPDAWAVYGDWLAEQGDPLGELVAVQIALGAKPDDRALQKKDRELRAANEEAWLGDLAGLDKDELETTWRYGFLEGVVVGNDEHSDADGPETIASLLALPTARFLEWLHIRIFEHDDGQPSYEAIIAQMAAQGLPSSLRELHFDVARYQISWTSLGDLTPLYPHLATLEELHLTVGSMELGAVALPRLKVLEIVTPGLTRENMAAINKASWPRLETLTLYTGSSEYGSTCTIADLAPVFAGTRFPAVEVLSLSNSEFADEIAKAICTAPVLQQLRELTLEKGTMTDAGAEVILAHAGAMTHLTRLDLGENYLTPRMVARLEAAFGTRLTPCSATQGEEDEEQDARYVQVAE